jgi:hypothetical protein
MAPVLSFLRPTNYLAGRVVLERVLELYLFGEKNLIKVAALVPQFRSFKFSSQNESHLRYLLKKCPWWIAGHLELGFLELKHGQSVPDKALSARSIATAKLSADAAKKLLGPVHLITKGRKLKLQLKARVLDGLVLSYHRKFEESLEVLKNVLALNNAMLLPKELLFRTLESAANSAYLTGNGQLALEYFNRVPVDKRSREGILIMDALKTEV